MLTLELAHLSSKTRHYDKEGVNMAQMLKHTLILPETDDAQAADLLRNAIGDLDIVLMLAFGPSARARQIVEWADQLCNKTQVGPFNLRRVVWVRDPHTPRVAAVLQPICGAKLPVVAVLDFHDDLKAALESEDKIDPLALEKAFLAGQV